MSGILCAQRVECCGYVKARLGISAAWIESFLIVAERQLHLVTYSSDNVESAKNDEKEHLTTVDLRKVISITFASPSQVAPCPTVPEPFGQPIAINKINKHEDTDIYIQGQFRTQTETWYRMIMREWQIPSRSELKDQYLTADNIPVAVEKCINFVSTYEGLWTRGIYRLSGQITVAKRLFDTLKSTNGHNVWKLHMRPEGEQFFIVL